jgi:hypothetical protein
VERFGTPYGRRRRPLAEAGRRPSPIREGVIAVEIVIVESDADQIDPELVRHIP